MKPPICTICRRRFFPPEGGLVTFVPTDEDKEELKRFEEPGFVGHPPNQFWFCGDHIAAARALQHLTRTEALPQLRGTQE